MGIGVMRNPLVKASMNCASTVARDTGSIFNVRGNTSFSCYAAETKTANAVT